MCRAVTGLFLILLSASVVARADEPKAKPSETQQQFEEQKKNYIEAKDAYEKLLKAGKTEEAQRALDQNNPSQYLTKMLLTAFLHPKDPASFDIVQFAIIHGEAEEDVWDQAMTLIKRDYSANERIKHLVRLLTKHTELTGDALHAIIANNPNEKVCARACQLLLDYVGTDAKVAEEVNLKSGFKPLLERRAGVEYVKRLLDSLEKNKKDAKDMTDLLEGKYKGMLPELALDKPLPEFTVEDLAGKKVKLSDLRGKVVVLNIFATTDKPAAILADSQQDLAKKQMGKPLSVVNVFVDEKKVTLIEFLKIHSTPWTNCWSGATDNLLEDWNLPKTPAIFIVDGKGVLRFRDRYRATLDDVLPELLKEAEMK